MFKSVVEIKGEKPSILLIDDDPIFREIMVAVAKSNGIKLDAFESVTKVSSTRKMNRYDAVLLDYDLADMTGFEIAEYLNQNFPLKPVVMVSSTNRPWQDKLHSLPNLRGFSSKWERPGEILRSVCSAANFELADQAA